MLSASINADRVPGLDGMVNVRELLINAVIHKEPKMLTGSAQKGCGWLFPSVLEIHGQIKPPVNRQDLNHSSVSYVEHGKPPSLPQRQVNRKEHCWRCR